MNCLIKCFLRYFELKRHLYKPIYKYNSGEFIYSLIIIYRLDLQLIIFILPHYNAPTRFALRFITPFDSSFLLTIDLRHHLQLKYSFFILLIYFTAATRIWSLVAFMGRIHLFFGAEAECLSSFRCSGKGLVILVIFVRREFKHYQTYTFKYENTI